MSNPWQPQQPGSTQCRNGITKWQGSAASIVNLATPGELSLTLYSPEITQLIVWFVFYAGHCSATCNTIFVGSQYIWTHLVEMFGLFLMVYRGHEKLIHIYHHQASIIWIPWNCIVENIKRQHVSWHLQENVQQQLLFIWWKWYPIVSSQNILFCVCAHTDNIYWKCLNSDNRNEIKQIYTGEYCLPWIMFAHWAP